MGNAVHQVPQAVAARKIGGAEFGLAPALPQLLGKSLAAGGTPLLPGIAPLQIFETRVSY